ncbi:MAG TPA: fatty acid oxidation complex subunit alpha FadJ [Anaeromyxobacteraceae bacterium]|nr:fatty acid oxidation complex subunit alpha FadJ [Anaeromyxobacteraceae bacterium]
MTTPTWKCFRVDVEGGVATVTIDVPGEPVNTLSRETGAELGSVLESLERDPAVKAVVFASGKKEGFVAGAKIEMLRDVSGADEAERLSRDAQAGFDRLERFPKPVVAAIHGACLGGGLEWAMACHYRVASNDRKTQLGLPEVQLGVIPGAGGTQRMPRLVGIATALDLILAGKTVKPRKALAIGLVDESVPPPLLLEVARARARALADGEVLRSGEPGMVDRLRKDPQATLQKLALEENFLGREVLFRQARRQLLAKTRGHYPAPLAALEAIQAGVEKGVEKGLEVEARLFGELAVSPVAKELMGIFFATTALKKDNGTSDPAVKARPVESVGVLGGGLMGSGIAYVTVNAGVPVRIREKDDAAVGRALASVAGIFDGRVKKRSIDRLEKLARMRLLTAGTGWDGMERVDVLVEAVFEDLKLKQDMLRTFEQLNPRGIFATNTSSIPVGDIAQASGHPETVLGMHYFSPVNKMPLLEVIVTPRTADEVTATAVALGKRQGKTVIVVGDGPGFYTSRILAPYVNEAVLLLLEGASVEDVDAALVGFGFPVGPVTLLDEVGIDVGAKVAKVMHAAFGDRMKPPEAMGAVLDSGRLGRKNGKGFYVYGDPKRKKEVDATVYDVLPGGRARKRIPREEIVERCVLQMVNEAVLTLGEGVLRSARDGDVGAVFGLGFPPFRGGPFRWIDAEGSNRILERMRRLEGRLGTRFRPAPLLQERGATGRTFHG